MLDPHEGRETRGGGRWIRDCVCPPARAARHRANAARHAVARHRARACKCRAGWNLNVPVEIRRTVDVLVLRRAVGRGESHRRGRRDRAAARPARPRIALRARAEDLAGRLTRRPIPEGTALTAEALGAALLIHRGQSVTLAARPRGVEVRAPGRAHGGRGREPAVRRPEPEFTKDMEGMADTEGVVRVTP